jgi:hypothetical protein
VAERPTDIRELLLIALAIVAGAVLAADLPFAGVPLAAGALGWLAYRYGYAAASGAAVLATAVSCLVAGSWVVAVLVAPALLAAGPLAAWALTRWPAMWVIVGVTLVVLAASVALDASVAAVNGKAFSEERRAESSAMREIVVQSAARSGSADTEAAAEIADQVARGWLTMWPSLYLYVAGLTAVLAVPAVSRAGRVLGREVRALPPLPELDFSLHIVWPAIAGLALLAAAVYLRRPDGWMQVLGANMLLIVRPVLFFQGVGDFAALYRKAGVGRLARFLGFVLLGLSESAVPSVSIVGLVDLFANFRKLPRGGEGAPKEAAPA